MIIPWREVATETLNNLLTEFVLREGTDYGIQEVPVEQKVAEVLEQLQAGVVVIVFSELYETVDVKRKEQLSEKDWQ